MRDGRSRASALAGALVLLLLLATGAPARAAVDDRPYGRFGRPLDRDPWSTAAQQLVAQQPDADPSTLAAIRTIADLPKANWYGGSATTVTDLVRNRVQDAARRGRIAQLVTFDLPHRGCGTAVEPGPQSAAEYRTWFRAFLRGLGSSRAIVIVEPDALGLASCLPIPLRLERYRLIRWSVQQLQRQGSWAYIDAGHSRWLSARVAANRLRASGVRWAAGFSLNVSNFRPDDELIRYGDRISKQAYGRHFVIDSGRNGVRAKNASYCNPPGKGLGRAPTLRTGVRRLDAYLWIKDPGSSDGTCRGGPSAGTWWQPYALMLVRNAHLR